MSDLAALVQQELVKLPPDRMLYYKSGAAWLRCPFHAGGQEGTPSAKINLTANGVPIGFLYCFGCHQKQYWNDFAALFGLTAFSKGMIREASASYLKDFFKKDPLPPDFKLFPKWPEDVPWRNIPGSVIKKLKGRSVVLGRNTRLYLPVTVYGENLGGIYAMLHSAKKETDKTYVNSDGEWSSKGLIGFDVARKMKGPLAIVEGSRDVGWTLANGWRVVGLIGSKVSPEKIRLIEDLDPPSILIATDPDDAGDSAAEDLTEAFAGKIPVKRLPLKRDKKTGKKLEDPADLSPKVIRKSRKLMIELFGG